MRIIFIPSILISREKKYGSNIFLKITFMPNFIKISDSHFGMFPCEMDGDMIRNLVDERKSSEFRHRYSAINYQCRKFKYSAIDCRM